MQPLAFSLLAFPEAGQRMNSPGSGGAGCCALNTGGPPAAASFSMVRLWIFHPMQIDHTGSYLERAKSHRQPLCESTTGSYASFRIFCPWCQKHGWPRHRLCLGRNGGTFRVPPSPSYLSQPVVLGMGGGVLACA